MLVRKARSGLARIQLAPAPALAKSRPSAYSSRRLAVGDAVSRAMANRRALPQRRLQLLPTLPPEPFGTRDLASLLGCNMLPGAEDCLLPASRQNRRTTRHARPHPTAPTNP
jgi:hypothetical protein